jgi:hypothetical protein
MLKTLLIVILAKSSKEISNHSLTILTKLFWILGRWDFTVSADKPDYRNGTLYKLYKYYSKKTALQLRLRLDEEQ